MATRLSELTGAAAGIFVICAALAAEIHTDFFSLASRSPSDTIASTVAPPAEQISPPTPIRYNPSGGPVPDATAPPPSPGINFIAEFRLKEPFGYRPHLAQPAEAASGPTLTIETTPPPHPGEPPASPPAATPPTPARDVPGISASDRAPAATAPSPPGPVVYGAPTPGERTKAAPKRADAAVPHSRRVRPTTIKSSPAFAPTSRTSTATKARRRPASRTATATPAVRQPAMRQSTQLTWPGDPPPTARRGGPISAW